MHFLFYYYHSRLSKCVQPCIYILLFQPHITLNHNISCKHVYIFSAIYIHIYITLPYLYMCSLSYIYIFLYISCFHIPCRHMYSFDLHLHMCDVRAWVCYRYICVGGYLSLSLCVHLSECTTSDNIKVMCKTYLIGQSLKSGTKDCSKLCKIEPTNLFHTMRHLIPFHMNFKHEG